MNTQNEKTHRCRVIAIANNKGGVGKTTTATQLAAGLAIAGKKVLFIDLDAQANATNYLLGPNTIDLDNEIENTVFEAVIPSPSGFVRRFPPTPIVEFSPSGKVDLIPSSLKMSWFDSAAATVSFRENLMTKNLSYLKNEYDIIILDCPPSLSLVVYNALLFATDIIIPTTPDDWSLSGVFMTMSFIEVVNQNTPMPYMLNVMGLLLTKCDHTTLTAEVRKNLQDSQTGMPLFETNIRKAVSIRKEQTEKMRFVRDPKYIVGAAADYRAFVAEVLQRIESQPIIPNPNI